jgi:hypothetical protein
MIEGTVTADRSLSLCQKGWPKAKGYPPAYKKSLFSPRCREKAGKTAYKDGLLLLLFKGWPVTSSLKRPQD